MRDYILAFKIVRGSVTIKAKSLDTDTSACIELPIADIQYIAKHYQCESQENVWVVVP